jgi:hypothetical protein
VLLLLLLLLLPAACCCLLPRGAQGGGGPGGAGPTRRNSDFFVFDDLDSIAFGETESVSRHLTSGLAVPDKSEVHQPVAALAAAGAKVLCFEGVKMVTSVRATQGKITVRGGGVCCAGLCGALVPFTPSPLFDRSTPTHLFTFSVGGGRGLSLGPTPPFAPIVPRAHLVDCACCHCV